MKYWEIDTEAVQEAIGLLEGGFIWDKTPQGVKYWRQVVDNLENIIEEAIDKE
jgi:hypothetical protein